MTRLILAVILGISQAKADFADVAQDQLFHFEPKPYTFLVIPFSAAGEYCHGGKARKWHSGCYDRGGQRAKIYIVQDHEFVMERVAWHECAHHAYGPAHEELDAYRVAGEDPQKREKALAHKQCMLDWYHLSR